MTYAYRDIKAQRPIRHAVAVTVYRAIWWPAVAVVVPFALVGGFVDWLNWTAFPWVADTTRPLAEAVHAFALAVGNLILGYTKEPETDQ